LVGYVCAEIATKYLNVEQAGTLALGVRPIRIRLFLMIGAATAVFLLLRMISVHISEPAMPWYMFALIACTGWYYWRSWKLVLSIGTPIRHRRLLAAAVVASFLGITLFAGACASTAFVSELRRMEISQFWKIVDRVHAGAGDDLDKRVKLLRHELDKLSLNEIAAFQRQYDTQIARAYRWDLWGAAYVMNGGCSDDGFRYFRDWLISEGSRTFEAALKSPESLADLPKGDFAENESFGYAALEAIEAKGGGQIERDMSGESGEPRGAPWKEEDLPELFPRLSKTYS
jgi:hypothetical protein